jgi:apolipoprotein N-acyltransferase
LALVSLVPLWVALELVGDGPWRSALGVGWLYGVVMIAGGYHWLVPFFEVFSGYGSFASVGFWIAFSAFIGAQYAVYGLAYWVLRRRGWSVAWTAIAPFVALEWLYPKLFPVFLANSFNQLPAFVQIAELGGPLLVTAVAASVNLAIFETWRWWRGLRRPPRAAWATAAVAVGATLLYGAIRIPQVEAEMAEAPPFRLGIVQVNMGIFAKRSEVEEGHRRHLEQSAELEQRGDLDLLIWPESAYVRSLRRKLPLDGHEVRRDLRTPILFGGVSKEEVDGRRRLFNTAFLINADGKVRSSYDKTYLLMFGEYLPFGETFPSLYELSPNSGRFSRGTHLRPLHLGQWRLSTPICYEDVLPGFTRDMVRGSNPHLLINITNDSWFGDTQEPWIHLVLAQFRAIEHRRYLVRATNSGISAVIDPLGRIVARTGVLTRENLTYEVRMMDGQTPYTRLGDWPGWLSVAALLWMLIARRGSGR